MVKPQFEVGRERLGAGGVVRDPGLRAEAVRTIAERGRGHRSRHRRRSPPARCRVRPATSSTSSGSPRRRAGRRRASERVRPGRPGRTAVTLRPYERRASRRARRRRVLLVTHTGREAPRVARPLVGRRFLDAGLEVALLRPRGGRAELEPDGVEAGRPTPSAGRAAARSSSCSVATARCCAAPSSPADRRRPLLGVNLGHVGFLAEAEQDDLAATVDRVVERRYDVEERLTLDVRGHRRGQEPVAATGPSTRRRVEKASRDRMLEVVAEVDGRPLSRWGCDGVVCATPTGSTAYASPPAARWCGPRSRRC